MKNIVFHYGPNVLIFKSYPSRSPGMCMSFNECSQTEPWPRSCCHQRHYSSLGFHPHCHRTWNTPRCRRFRLFSGSQLLGRTILNAAEETLSEMFVHLAGLMICLRKINNPGSKFLLRTWLHRSLRASLFLGTKEYWHERYLWLSWEESTPNIGPVTRKT